MSRTLPDDDTERALPAQPDTQSSASPSPRRSPYQGLTPYATQDAAFFFGREREREVIAANLVAARLTVLYGPSGVGKSSLLHAGVGHDLFELAQRNRAKRGVPEFAAVIFSSWHEPDVVAAVRQAVHEQVTALAGDAAPEPVGELADYLAACAEAVGGDMLLILDQFEEYFLYHPRDEGPTGFDAQLARAVTRPDLRANFLIAIREDAVAKLDRFKGRIPHLFDNYLRVRHLDRTAARSAIEQPIERFNQIASGAGDVEIEPELVERILDQVTAGEVILQDAGAGGAGSAATQPGAEAHEKWIETPFLQLVLTRLWAEELGGGSRKLRLATLERLGGASQIVHVHVDESLAELTPEQRDLAAQVFRHLVTPSGTKVALAPSDLAEYADVSEAGLLLVLERLSQGSVRILRPVADDTGHARGARYEIFHDVLAAPILDWRRRHVAAAQRAEEEAKRRAAEHLAHSERRRARTFRALAIAAGVFAVGSAILAMLAIRAEQQAQSQRLAAQANASLQADPGKSLRLAADALDARQTPQAQEALRTALGRSRVRAVLRGHTDWINSAAFDRNGRRVATAAADGTVRIWNARTGGQVAAIRGDGKPVITARFDRDGQRVISYGNGSTVRVSDATDGHELRRLRPGAGRLYAPDVAFSRDGRRIVTVGRGRRGIAIWDPGAKAAIKRLGRSLDDVVVVGMSADARFVAAGTTMSGPTMSWHVWDARSGRRVAVTGRRSGAPQSAAFSPDGRRLVLSSLKKVYLWNWGRGDRLRPLDAGSRGSTVSAQFSDDGRAILTAGDKQAWLWSGSTGKEIATLNGHEDNVDGATFGAGGRLIATTSDDGTARLWSRTGALLADLRGHSDAVFDASISRDGRSIVTAGADRTARVWRIDPDRVLLGHRDWVASAQFSSTGRRVLTASVDGVARIWNAASGRREHAIDFRSWFANPYNAYANGLNAAALSPDGRRVAAVGQDGDIAIQSAGDTFPESSWIEQGPMRSVSFSHDGRRLVVSCDECGPGYTPAVLVLDSRNDRKKRVAMLRGPREVITSARFSPDGRFVVTAGADKEALIWRATGGRPIRRLRGHAGVVWNANWSADGRRIVTAGNDGTVRVWDARSGKPVGPSLSGFEGAAKDAVFGHGDEWVLAAGVDGTMRIWNLATARPLAIMHKHAAPIAAVAFSRNGDILTAGDDRTARLYRCETCAGIDALREIAERRQRYVASSAVR